MYTVISWMRSWWGGVRVVQHVEALSQKTQALRRERARSDQRLDDHLQHLDELRSELITALDKARVELEESRVFNKKLQAALDVSQEALEAANEIVIPGLVAANRTMIGRWEAETAVLATRKAALAADRE